MKEHPLILFKKQFGFMFLTSIMFIASFLWRDLLKDIEDLYLPRNSLLSRFLYTVSITIILAFAVVYLKRAFDLGDNVNIGHESDPDPMKHAVDDQSMDDIGVS